MVTCIKYIVSCHCYLSSLHFPLFHFYKAYRWVGGGGVGGGGVGGRRGAKNFVPVNTWSTLE